MRSGGAAAAEGSIEAGVEAAGTSERIATFVVAAAPPGRHSAKSSRNIGFTVVPNRDASSVTKAASTCCDPVIAAMSSPATLTFPAGWFTTVKKTPTVSVTEFEDRADQRALGTIVMHGAQHRSHAACLRGGAVHDAI